MEMERAHTNMNCDRLYPMLRNLNFAIQNSTFEEMVLICDQWFQAHIFNTLFIIETLYRNTFFSIKLAFSQSSQNVRRRQTDGRYI
jgi:hypothetical protein